MTAIVSTPESTEPKMVLNFKFRWAIHQVSQDEVEMMVPMGANAMFHIDWNQQAVKTLGITEAEQEQAHNDAVEAVVRSIAIVK
ncbi:MAG TPA: hypothetical protein VIY48_00750 [Candidatus Paceibacterota bacterium]